MVSTNLRDDLMFSCLVATLVTGDHPASPGLVSGVPWCPLPHGLAPPRTQPQLLLYVFSGCCVRPDGGAINMQIM